MNSTKGFVFLEPKHPIVESVIKKKLIEFNQDKKLSPLDTKVADFDGAMYHIQVAPNSSKIEFDFIWDPISELGPLGSQEVLNKQYSSYSPKPSQNSLHFEISPEKCSGDMTSIDLTTIDFCLLKRRIFGAPLSKAFADLAAGTAPSTKKCKIDLRQKREQVLISPLQDQVLVAFYINYLKKGEKDSTDSRIAEIFLQKFAGKKDFGNAPGVRFIKELPKEFKGMSGVIMHPKNTPGGWVEFNIRQSHVSKDGGTRAIDLLLSLRQYLQYHIKATKAQLHQRMRFKVKSFLQVLNRARPDEEKTKKAYRVINN